MLDIRNAKYWINIYFQHVGMQDNNPLLVVTKNGKLSII